VAIPGIVSKLEAGGDVDGLVEGFVAAVRGLAAGPGRAARDGASVAVGGEVVGDGPIPAFAFVAEADAAEVQVAVGDDGVVGAVGRRIFAVEVAGADPVVVREFAGDAEFIHEARGVVQNEGGQRNGGALKSDLIDVVPIGPVQVEFEIPIGRGPDGHAEDGELGVADGAAGGGARRGADEGGVALVFDFGGGAIVGAERNVFARLPHHAGVEAEVGSVAAKIEAAAREGEGAAKFGLGIIDGGADADGKCFGRLPGDDGVDGGVEDFAIVREGVEGIDRAPIEAEAVRGVDAEAEGELGIFGGPNGVGLGHGLEDAIGFGGGAGGAGVFGARRNGIHAEADVHAFDLGDSGGVVVNGRGVVGSGGESVAAGDGFGILIGEAEGNGAGFAHGCARDPSKKAAPREAAK